MNRLVFRAVEEFLRDTYGDALWREVVATHHEMAAGEEGAVKLAMPAHAHLHGAERLISVAAGVLGKPADELFEDLGAWLARREAIRRLLRFSGRDFGDFVLSLEELPGRAHFVIPDLDMPRILVERESASVVRLVLPPHFSAWTAILGGLLRAMADDYGALGLILVKGCAVEVHISDESFARGRDFNLGAGYRPDAADFQ